MSDYDPELELINARKLLKLKKKASSDKKPSSDKNVKTDRDLFLEHLVDRGIEVLTTAELQYPNETVIIITKIVELIKNGELRETISGGALLSLFRSIGLPVRMDTKINVEEHGRIISLADRLNNKE